MSLNRNPVLVEPLVYFNSCRRSIACARHEKRRWETEKSVRRRFNDCMGFTK